MKKFFLLIIPMKPGPLISSQKDLRPLEDEPPARETDDSKDPNLLSENERGNIRTLLESPDDTSLLNLRQERLLSDAARILRSADTDLYSELKDHLWRSGIQLKVPGIAAEAMWGAHFFEGGIQDPSVHNTCYHFTLIDHLIGEWVDEEHAEALLELMRLGQEVNPRVVELLGRIKALADLREVSTKGSLPLLYDNPDRTADGAPYLDLATGPDILWTLSAVAKSAHTKSVPILFNDTSPFVLGQFREACTAYGIPNDRVSFLQEDATQAVSHRDRGSVGTIHLNNIAEWIPDTSPTWYSDIAERVTPHRGKLIVSIKDIPKIELPDGNDQQALQAFRAAIEQKGKGEPQKNLAMAMQFHKTLCQQQESGIWQMELGFASTGEKWLGPGVKNIPEGNFPVLSCVFTRLS